MSFSTRYCAAHFLSMMRVSLIYLRKLNQVSQYGSCIDVEEYDVIVSQLLFIFTCLFLYPFHSYLSICYFDPSPRFSLDFLPFLSLPVSFSLFLSFSLSIYLSFSYTTFLSHFITVSHYRCLSSSVSVRDVLSSIPFVSIIEGFDPATSGSRSDQAHYHPRLVTVTLIQHSITNITLL